ncbi:MAG: DUF5689 domain-containing protein [Alistipes sp.]|nr:DUF5689 domain-containing protein [Alistipes sp.]
MDRFICLITVLTLLLYGCGYDKTGDWIAPQSGILLPNANIGTVRAMCGDGVMNVTDSIIVAGYISANDKSGNIYRSFFIEDGTGAMEIRAGMYSLHNTYIQGRYTAVKLYGLTVSLYNGTLQAGMSVNDYGNAPGYIDSWTVAGDYLVPGSEFNEVEPLPLTVPQLLPQYCGRLITIPGLVLVEDEESGEDDGQEEEDIAERIYPAGDFIYPDVTWAYPRTENNPVPQAAYRYFADAQGNTVAVYTSGYATFAGLTVPVGRVTVTGILSLGTAGYYIRLRSAEDAVLDIN